MEKEIENLIEELTKVRPEMLNEEALKLFNTIMAVLDERDKLKEENQELINELQDKDDEIRFANRDIKVFETDFIPTSKIKEKIEEYKQEMKEIREKEKGLIWNHRLHKLDYAIQVLQELLGG